MAGNASSDGEMALARGCWFAQGDTNDTIIYEKIPTVFKALL
jgi:hypothetical protein